MTQYIITEEELVWIPLELEKVIRSRLYNPQSERDTVLDDLQRFVREDRGVNFQIGKRLVLNKIAELRAGSP